MFISNIENFIKMKSKNKTIFAFLLVFTLIFSFGLTSAYGDTELSLDNLEVQGNADETSVSPVTTYITWDSPYLELKLNLEIKKSSESTWNTVIGSEEWKVWDLSDLSWDSSVGGLEPNTQYDIRTISTEYKNTDTGQTFSGFIASNTVTFTTDYENPSLEDAVATDIDQNSAFFNSRVTDMGSADSLEVYFEYREDGESWISTKDTGDYSQTITSSGTNFGFDITTLYSGTTYDVRACAYDSDNSETECSNTYTFQTESINKPSISTLSPSTITFDSGIFRGELNSLGGYSSVDLKFYWRYQGDTLWLEETDSETTLSSTGTVSYEKTGLGWNNTIEYALAYYDTETSSWVRDPNYITFTTLDLGDVSVNTESPSNVTGNSANLNGYITLGEEDNTTAWFQYRQSEVGSWTNTSNITTTESSSYNIEVTGLNTDTSYDYRAIMKTASGTTYTSSIIETFTTATSGSPEIKTLEATEVTHNSSILNSELTSVDENTIGIFWQYKKFADSEWKTLEKVDVSNPSVSDTYSTEVTGLNPNTLYDFRAGVYSYDLDQNYYGNVKDFITKSPPWKKTDTKTFNSAQEFESFISNLNPDTTYEFRAIMEYDSKTKTGDTEIFQTSLIPPEIIQDLGEIKLGFNEKREIDINENYKYWDSYTVQINGQNVYSSTNFTTEEGDIVINADISQDKLIINSFETEGSYNGKITLTNSEGSTIDEFTIKVEPSFFQKIINGIVNIFPDSEDLNTGQKVGYVLVTMLVITIIMVAIGTTTGGVSKGILILTGILNFLIFIFYIAIGYISLGILISFILLAVAVIYFRIRGGGE